MIHPPSLCRSYHCLGVCRVVLGEAEKLGALGVWRSMVSIAVVTRNQNVVCAAKRVSCEALRTSQAVVL